VSYLPALFGTLAAYILLAVLLLSLNIASLWRWWVKLGAIVLTTGAFIGAYLAITGLIGWPSPQAIPGRFSLLATRIVEPDKASGAPGHLYMWIEAIDEKNLPISQPRNHEVAYTAELANALYAAQQKLNDGQAVLGEMLQPEEPSEGEEGEAENATPGAHEEDDGSGDEGEDASAGAGNLDRTQGPGEGYLLDITESLKLSDMPPPELPDKA
jgi:hypothetical protein